MFVMWLFSFFDLLVLIVMLGTHLDIFFSWRLLVGSAFYLFAKGFLFRGDILSMLDVIVGVYLIVLLLGAHWFLTWIFAGYLLYKLIWFFFAVVIIPRN